MRVALGKFACAGLEAQADGDLPTGVHTALVHYSQKLKAGRSVDLPGFLLSGQEPEVDVEVELDPESEARLAGEAERQGATMDQIALHSVMIYLAELEFLGIALPPRELGDTPA